MSKSKVFNGKFVHEYLHKHPMLWRAVADTLWGDKHPQKKTYFEKKTDVNSTTLFVLHEVTGLPWEYFFIGEGDPEPNPNVIDQHLDIHHNRIQTLNANTNPEVLLAYIDMSKKLNDEKDKRIADLQKNIERLENSRDELLRRHPSVKSIVSSETTD